MSWEWQNDQPAWNLSSPYQDLSGFQDAYAKIAAQQVGLGSGDRPGLVTRLNDVASQFKTQFKNLVGRDPTNDEINQFYQQSGGNVIANSPSGRSENNTTDVRNQIVQYVGDSFQQQAKDYATQQLTGQQGQANQLADMFRTQGRAAISSTEQNLMDYQQKLFEKLRPNLITSLDAQGLLDTGGLNQALAGAQQNLADNAQGYLIDANMHNEQGANQIAFGGASAPYYFQQNQIMQQPGYLQQAGQNALSSNNATYMDNLNYAHQLGLIQAQMKAQQELQPSFLRTFSQSTGQNLGANFNGPNWLSAINAGKTSTPLPGGMPPAPGG